MSFEELGIAKPILEAVAKKGYVSPTEIQKQSIPIILRGRDLQGIAQTGTGKTAAFAIPIIQHVDKINNSDRASKRIKALIVTPTRELAIQIDENIKAYSSNCRVSHTVIFGGVTQGAQVNKLSRGVDILTATPGRLLDLIGQGLLDISQIEIFVLDEADRMLDMGFINDIKKILQLIPDERQTLFFSATMPQTIVSLANSILKNPEKVEITPPSATADTVTQYVYYTNKNLKAQLLDKIIKDNDMEQVLVFTRTKHGADRVVKTLRKTDIQGLAIHGNKSQNQRQNALKKFTDKKVQVLVATDIAARGIDIDKLQYVINYDVPNMPESYIHRIGRCGRAGETGVAFSICEPEENAYMKDIQKLIGNKAEVLEAEGFEQTDKPMTAAEKKEWQKEKDRKKREFFANRKKGKGGNQRGGDKNSDRKPKAKKSNTSDTNNRKSEDAKPAQDGGGSPQGQKKKRRNNNNGGKKRYRSTDASEKLKGKFMWPLE